LLILAVVNPFTEIDCDTIRKLLMKSLRHEVEIIGEERESDENFVEEQEENTDT
jgi:hypothetical protein